MQESRSNKGENMAEKMDPLREVNEIVEMLMALAPTNNRISQLILIAPGKDYKTVKEMYPDLMSDKRIRDRVLRALGMAIRDDGKIAIEYYGLGSYLDSVIKSIFELFGREDTRDKITAALLNEKISNLHEDWVWARLKTIEEMAKEEGSPAAVSILVLKVLKNLRDKGGYEYNYVEIDKIAENMGETGDESLLADAIDILMRFGLLVQTGEKYGLSDELWRYKLLIDDIDGE